MDPGPSQARTTAFAEDTDADLLAWMALAAEDADSARRAWEAFYLRHVRYLYAVCLRAYGMMLGEDGVADVVADTFARAYERAGTYAVPGDADVDRQRRLVRGWLGRIAQRLAQDVLRGRGRLKARNLAPEHWQQLAESPATNDDDGREPQRVQAVREALATLSEREATVLRVTMQWYRPESEHQRLPNDVAADLARAFGTTPENLRQVRRRAIKKVEQQLRQGGWA